MIEFILWAAGVVLAAVALALLLVSVNLSPPPPAWRIDPKTAFEGVPVYAE
jgi:hypothetical protein